MNAVRPDVGDGTAARGACAQRLRRSADVRAALGARRAAGSAVAVVHARRRAAAGAPRTTVVAGKKVGNAVARNRVKRRLRAALAQVQLPAGVDVVVVGRAAAATTPFTELTVQVQQLVAKATGRR